MRAEELDNLTEERLQEKANICFIAAENTNIHLQGGDAERLRLHLEAQFYLTAVARKRDDRVAQRDFRMEVAVIVLISVEIVISLAFGFLGLREGSKQAKVLERQAKVLEHMDQSAAHTASAMGEAKTALQMLTDQQKTSLDSQKLTNQNLQASLKQTRTMASTLQTQLGIFQKEQADKLAQLSRKPKLVLWWGDDVPLNRPNYNFTPVTETDTAATFNFNLRNHGDAAATKIHIRVEIRGADRVRIQSNPPVEPPSGPFDSYKLEFPSQRPKTAIPIIMTFAFQKGQTPFYVYFQVEADEIEPTSLGMITITPRMPQNQ